MNNFEIEITDQDLKDWEEEFTDKESYLKWVDEWKAEYKKLSQAIHDMRKTRKMYLGYELNEEGTKYVRKDNPLYDPNYSQWEEHCLSKRANEMMEQRMTAKWISRIMRQNTLKEAA